MSVRAQRCQSHYFSTTPCSLFKSINVPHNKMRSYCNNITNVKIVFTTFGWRLNRCKAYNDTRQHKHIRDAGAHDLDGIITSPTAPLTPEPDDLNDSEPGEIRGPHNGNYPEYGGKTCFEASINFEQTILCRIS